MTKQKAKKMVLEYFKKNLIPYRFLNEENRPITLESSDTVYLCVEVPEVIGKHIETSIRFRAEHLYCQAYYCQTIVHTKEEAVRAARIVNYLNRYLTYDCDTLYDHSFIVDEEEGDIFNGCLIRYELLEKYFYETMDHILNFSVQQLTDVCVPVVLYTAGKISYFEAAKVYIDNGLMGKPIPETQD